VVDQLLGEPVREVFLLHFLGREIEERQHRHRPGGWPTRDVHNDCRGDRDEHDADRSNEKSGAAPGGPLNGCGDLRRRFVRPRTHGRDEAIAEPRHRRDVAWIPRVVAEQPAQGGHRLVDGVLCHHDARPDVVEQFLDAHGLTRTVGQVQEQPQCARLQAFHPLIARELARSRVQAPVADAQRDESESIHA